MEVIIFILVLFTLVGFLIGILWERWKYFSKTVSTCKM